MKRLQALYNLLSFREKLLLGGFLWVIAILWLNNVVTRLNLAYAEMQAQRTTLTAYEGVVAQKPQIDQALEVMEARFDKDRTRGRTELQGHIDQLLRRSNLRPQNFRVRTDEDEILDWHELRLRVANADLMDVLSFESRIRAEAPYITLERLVLRVEPRNPARVSAEFSINSFELKSSGTDF